MRSTSGILLCFCLIHDSYGFMAQLGQMFGSNGMLAGRIPGLTNSNVSGIENVLPSICETNLCLPYTVIEKTPAYEHRRYEVMVVAVAEATSQWMPGMITFSRLKKYFKKGQNAEASVMNLTFPVLSPINSSMAHASMMALPPGNSGAPPEPTSPTVTIMSIPAMDVFVKPHTSTMFGSNADQAITQFKTELGPSVPLHSSGAGFIAEYNEPFKFFGRRGEIWLVADDAYRPGSTQITAVDVPNSLAGEPSEYP